MVKIVLKETLKDFRKKARDVGELTLSGCGEPTIKITNDVLTTLTTLAPGMQLEETFYDLFEEFGADLFNLDVSCDYEKNDDDIEEDESSFIDMMVDIIESARDVENSTLDMSLNICVSATGKKKDEELVSLKDFVVRYKHWKNRIDKDDGKILTDLNLAQIDDILSGKE